VICVWECALKGRLKQDRTCIADKLSDWIVQGFSGAKLAEIRHISSDTNDQHPTD
jgi:hypothetical protein